MLPCPGYCKQCCNEHWGTCVCFNSGFLGVYAQQWDCDWFTLAVEGTLKILLQHHNSKASVLQCSVFFMIQLSNPYMTTGKAIVLTIRTFVGKVMSLLFNKLSTFVINEDHGIRSHHFMANRETMEIMTDFIFLGSKITSDGNCSHEIKRCLLHRRKGENRLYIQ